jgi:hypothetical protein
MANADDGDVTEKLRTEAEDEGVAKATPEKRKREET